LADKGVKVANAQVKRLAKRAFFQLHKLGIKCGVFVLPVHYYVQFPNVLELERTRDIWARPSSLPGLAIDLQAQLGNLRAICLPFLDEYRENHSYKRAVAQFLGPGYGYIEAQALHGVVRHYKPHHVVEIGCGVSTFCILAAADANANETGASTKVTCIEPHPSSPLRALGGIDLLAEQVQAVPLDLFTQLESGDLLFIDSSHTVKPGGDVNYLILEVLPRLKAGVVVHFHDIPFPYDYQPSTLKSFMPWSEGSLLQAYLAHNAHASVVFSLSLLHHEAPRELAEVFPDYAPQPQRNGLLPNRYIPELFPAEHFPSSIYLIIQ
jgi:predicted O-methyltransferase YrrM